MFNSRSRVLTLCRVGVLAAMYVPLALYVAVRMGNIQISFGSLPVVTAALLLGPAEAALVAFIGEFFKQLLTYGITATTVLYLIPPALRGLIIGAAALKLRKTRGQRLEERRWRCYGVCIAAAVVTTAGNTLVNLVDSLLYHYYSFAYIFGDALIRFATGMLNAVIIATAAIPLVQLLRRHAVRQQA